MYPSRFQSLTPLLSFGDRIERKKISGNCHISIIDESRFLSSDLKGLQIELKIVLRRKDSQYTGFWLKGVSKM